MPFTSGSRARISLMRRASVSQFSTVMALEPTRITSSTSSRATFFSAGMASATSPACSLPDGVLAMVPPVATTLMSGSLSCACEVPTLSKMVTVTILKKRKMVTVTIFWLLPGAVVYGVFVGRARGHEAPVARPLVGVLEALARVGLGRRIEDASELEVFELEHASGFLDEVVRVLRRILVDGARGLGFRQEHLVQRRAVELVARGFAARRVRLHQHAQSLLLGDADPGLHQADRRDLAALQRLDALAHGAGEFGLDLLALEEAFQQF